jgi:hypothetical protein
MNAPSERPVPQWEDNVARITPEEGRRQLREIIGWDEIRQIVKEELVNQGYFIPIVDGKTSSTQPH